MSETVRTIINIAKAIAINIGVGALLSFVFYYLKKKDLFGGYLGGMVIGIIGSLIGGLILDRLLYDITVVVLEFLTRGIGYNVIAALIGAYIALFIMNKLNHDKERTKY